MSTPQVSVIVPVYNVEPYILRCLNSLVHQTWHDLEIICIDDCGADSSMAIVEQCATNDNRIKIVRHVHNKGLGASRNTGLKVACAPYIMFCDSDDYYAPTMVEEMLKAITAGEGVDYAACGGEIEYHSHDEMRHTDAKYYQIRYRGLVAVTEEVLLHTDVSVWNKIFRHNLIKKYGISFPEGVLYEDTFFFYTYGIHAKNACYIEKKLYHYQRHAQSIMSQTFGGRSDYLIHFMIIGEKIRDYLKENQLLHKHAKLFLKVFFSLLNSALGYEKIEERKAHIFDYAERILSSSDIQTDEMQDMKYACDLLRNRIPVGSVRKRWGGVLRIKYKAHYAKCYFCGLPFMILKTVVY